MKELIVKRIWPHSEWAMTWETFTVLGSPTLKRRIYSSTPRLRVFYAFIKFPPKIT